LPTPDPVPAGGPSAPGRPVGLPSQGPLYWLLVIAVALLTARLTLISVQYGCTIALVVVTVGLYVRSRTAGLVAVWLCWLLAPFVRRLFLLSDPVVGAEPLALAPFLVTAIVIGLELQQMTLTPQLRRMLQYVAIGFGIGVPLGFANAPAAAAFAFFAYVTAGACMVLGYREATEVRPVLPRLLVAATPFLALYAFRQYYVLPLPEWDEVWRSTSDFGTGGSSDQGRIRVWSTLNSPGTFAALLGIAVLAYLTVRRITAWTVVGGLAVIAALALTYVRSAWLGVVIALVAIVFVTRGAALKRVVPLVLILAALGPVALGGSTGEALSERAGTFGNLSGIGGDESGGARGGTWLVLIPFGISQPLGSGLGTAGEPTRLAGGGVRVTDNGYISLLYQVGPFGFALVMMAAIGMGKKSFKNARRHPHGLDLLVFGAMVFSAVIAIFGDQLYGVGGMMFWYSAGYALGRSELMEEPAA
jgi:putative inorganic carbon (hco3(-)) transporter